MQYNKIHDQYRLGLDLWFRLQFGHKEHPNGWTVLSNIPALNLKKLEAATKIDAGIEVMGNINCGLELDYTTGIFIGNPILKRNLDAIDSLNEKLKNIKK